MKHTAISDLPSRKLTYVIDLNERGSFRAHVEDEQGKIIFNILAGDELGPDESSIFEDGFMRHEQDYIGLYEYLIDLGIARSQDEIYAEF